MIDFGETKRAVEATPRPLPFRRLIPLTRIALDGILIYAAFVLAYWTRYVLEVGPPIHDRLAFSAYQPLAFLLLAILMPLLLMKGAYQTKLGREMVDDLGLIVSSTTLTVGLMVVATAMVQQGQYSRGVLLYLWVLLIVLLAVGRGTYRSVQSLLYRRGVGVRRLLVVGATDMGKMVMQSVMGRRDLGYRLVGFVDQAAAVGVRDFGRFRALGTVADLPDLLETGQVDDVIIALPASAHEEVWSVLSLCENHGVGVKLVPDLFEMSLSRVEVDDIAGIPLLDVQEKPLRQVARAVKRALDVAVSLCTLVVTSPIVAVCALLIKLESRGPVLLCQTRVGVNEKPFGCMKLRTMRADAQDLQSTLQPLNEAAGPIFKMRDDPRVTRIGRWMRRWSIDELPQMWNVLLGDMSLVGPRPPLPQEVERYEPLHRRRLEIKPGVTGLWQVSGRSDLHFDEMVMMDIYYVDNWSVALDLKILARTVAAVLARHGAY